MNKSIILNTDSYKFSQWKHYPPQTEYIYSYIESRGGIYDKLIFFGLQAFLKEYLSPVTYEDILLAKAITTPHGVPFNEDGWMYILKNHHGKLPLRIKAVPEGSIVPTKNVLVTIENTDKNCYWLTSFIETALLRSIWYPTTVATNSWHSKQIIKESLEMSGNLENLPFMLNDFGSRGVSSFESSMIGGAAHLVNFLGTDNVAALQFIMEYYNGEMSGLSVPATEHSCITSWGKEFEIDSYRNLINSYPNSIVSIVADSYNVYEACNIFGTELKRDIINNNTKLVIRLDSGDPKIVIPKVLDILETHFGTTTNSKNYKVLNNVKILQSDGIDHDEIKSILFQMTESGFSADNILFGQGGALLQKLDRDTLKFAMKCSAACVDSEWRHVFKDPITDPGKRSKSGRVTLYYTKEYRSGVEDWEPSALETVFENGNLMNQYSFNEIRERANMVDISKLLIQSIIFTTEALL